MARRTTTGRGTIIHGFAAMTRGDVRFFRAAGLGFLLVGLLMALGFGTAVGTALAFRARAVVLEATVTGLREWPQERGPGLVSPEFAFVLPDGTRATALGPSALRACCRVGEVVALRVDPADPREVAVADGSRDWGTALALALFGLVLMGVGLLGLAVARKGAAAQAR